jgi:hypothetical protein
MPNATVSEIEEQCRAKSARRLDAPDCVIRFRRHTATSFHCFWRRPALNGRATSAHRLGAAVAVQGAKLLRGDGVFTKCALELAKPFIIVPVYCLIASSIVAYVGLTPN